MGMDCGIRIRGLQMRRAREERFHTFVRNDGQGKEQRDFSLRRPTHSQERMRKKKSACPCESDGGRGARGRAGWELRSRPHILLPKRKKSTALFGRLRAGRNGCATKT